KEFFESNSQVDLFSDPTEIYSTYGLRWCATVLSLMPVLAQKTEDENLKQVLYEVELPLIEVMAAMERDGVTVDRKELTYLGEVITAQVETITQKIYD
ncbi:hypothetical protein P0G10_20565, partial [Eubacteriales bacterium DFI.9.88]|nr:hypothetical protein [Eubacteriales bacterium DFI.9.88]